MSLAEVLPNLKTLNRSEKLRVVKILIDEITQEEESFLKAARNMKFGRLTILMKPLKKLMQMLEENKPNA